MRTKQKMKCIRIQKDVLIKRIIEKYGSLTEAAKVMGRSHDYLSWKMRTYNIEVPEKLLLEIWQKLGVEYRDLCRRNQTKYTDNQICFEAFGDELKKEEQAEAVEDAVVAPNTQTEIIKMMIDMLESDRETLMRTVEVLKLILETLDILPEQISNTIKKEWRITIS